MAFADHIRVTAMGTIGPAGGDRFSYGFSMIDQDQGDIGDLFNTTPNWSDIADDVATFHASNGAKISADCVLDMVKIALIGPDGSYKRNNAGEMYQAKLFPKNTPGTGVSSSKMVPQMAVAVTLDTDRYGPTGRGRFYLPMVTADWDKTDRYRMTSPQALAIRDAVVTMINNVANEPGFDTNNLRVVVASTKGYNTIVQRVRVGRVCDTIRSRRSALEELHTPAANVTQ